jgi:hypothetical protein
MGFPPASWSYRVWPWLHGVMRKLDSILATREIKPTMAEIVRWLRQFAKLLPCEVCQVHFSEMLAVDFDEKTGRVPTLASREPFTWFGWTVDARHRISTRIGRPVRSRESCALSAAWDSSTPSVVLEWYGHAWNALQIMSFNAPVTPTAEWQQETDFFLRFMSRIFPNADTAIWDRLVDDQNVRLRGQLSNPPVVSEIAPWCASRERFMLTIHRFRCEAQIEPKFQVPPLVTIVHQWVSELNSVVAQFRAQLEQQQQQRAAASKTAASAETKTVAPDTTAYTSATAASATAASATAASATAASATAASEAEALAAKSEAVAAAEAKAKAAAEAAVATVTAAQPNTSDNVFDVSSASAPMNDVSQNTSSHLRGDQMRAAADARHKSSLSSLTSRRTINDRAETVAKRRVVRRTVNTVAKRQVIDAPHERSTSVDAATLIDAVTSVGATTSVDADADADVATKSKSSNSCRSSGAPVRTNSAIRRGVGTFWCLIVLSVIVMIMVVYLLWAKKGSVGTEQPQPQQQPRQQPHQQPREELKPFMISPLVTTAVENEFADQEIPADEDEDNEDKATRQQVNSVASEPFYFEQEPFASL